MPQILLKYRFHDKRETIRLKEKHPESTKKLRNQVLSQLDPTLRKEYEIALEKYQKNLVLDRKFNPRFEWDSSFSERVKQITFSFLTKVSPSYAKKASKLYKKISKNKIS